MDSSAHPLTRLEHEPLAYDGKHGPFLKLHIVNLLLTLCTLGIFRFWARTRSRRYVWGHTAFLGDRFEYAGTGKELFIGFLKAIVVIALLIAVSVAMALVAAAISESDAEREKYTAIFSLPFYLALFYLSSVGAYAARRYRMSRTIWRGIRFEQQGSPFIYANMALGGSLLAYVSLGLYFPTYATRLIRYELDNLRFGTLTFRSDIAARDIRRPFLIAWGISVVAAPVFIGAVIYAGNAFQKGETVSSLVITVAIVIAFQILPFAWAGFAAAMMRSVAAHTFAGALGFSCSAPMDQLYRLWVGNFLLSKLTLGLLRPIATNRSMRFFARHYRLDGMVDLAGIAAAPAGPRSGEGLAGYFDIDALPG